MILRKFQIKNFRSLINVDIKFIDNLPIVISGENNIGKTNFLRALNVYFNHIHDKNLYHAEADIPHHIYYGSRGGRTKTELIGEFDDHGKIIKLLVHFDAEGNSSYKLDTKDISDNEAFEFLSRFKFIFIESHNIHLPSLIGTILEKDGLLALDKKRAKQSRPLEKLQEFIELSREAITDIENNINYCFKELTDFDGILKEAKILINFAEFDRLRDVIRTMTSITLQDGNNHEIESKGSGAQRAVFLSLMKYISKNIKNKKIIWAIDEPEAFLQPKLQRKVFETLQSMCKEEKQTIILTTHSQHFINLRNVDTVNLFIGNSELKEYKRRPGKIFHEINTQNFAFTSTSEKIKAIKEHLGIKSNDGWELLPFNVLVEGEEDKKYLEKLMEAVDIEIPNIICAGGATKIAGYLQYYNDFAKDNPFSEKPKILCIFDNDKEGRESKSKINPQKLTSLEIESILIPRHDYTILYDNPRNFSGQSQNWAIEDFLSPALIMETANNLLRKDKYKIIGKRQIKVRNQVAHRNKIILEYLSECTSQNNPDKDDYLWGSDGRKIALCKSFCDNQTPEKILEHLNQNQRDFLNKLKG